jgi:hypothetical protein
LAVLQNEPISRVAQTLGCAFGRFCVIGLIWEDARIRCFGRAVSDRNLARGAHRNVPIDAAGDLQLSQRPQRLKARVVQDAIQFVRRKGDRIKTWLAESRMNPMRARAAPGGTWIRARQILVSRFSRTTGPNVAHRFVEGGASRAGKIARHLYCDVLHNGFLSIFQRTWCRERPES